MQAQQVPPLIQFVPMVFVFAIFYLLLIRPQQKKEKEHQKMLRNIKKNDEVVTASGIHAVVLNVKEKTVSLRIDDNVKIELDRDAVSRIEKIAN